MQYSIGEVAKKLKINRETIRYYEKIGLLQNTKRDSNKYRVYTQEDMEVLQFILMAKEYDFTLREIGIILKIDLHNCDKLDEGQVIDIIDKKVNEIDKKVEELILIKKVLSKIKTDVVIKKTACYYGKSLNEILDM